jgi:hypothetical protein
MSFTAIALERFLTVTDDMHKKATRFNGWLPAFASDIFME